MAADILGTPRPQGLAYDIGAYEMWSEEDCLPASSAPAVREGSRADLRFANPLRPGSEIAFSLSTAGDVRLEVFDAAGRRVGVLEGWREARGYHVTWPPLLHRGLGSGLYFLRLSGDPPAVSVRKLLVVD